MSARRATLPLRETLAQAVPERPYRVELWDGSTLPPTNGASGPTFRLRSPRADVVAGEVADACPDCYP
jgi:hypothetical protein